MTQARQIQTWKQNRDVVQYMAMSAKAGTPIEPPQGRANFYPEGAMMFNGGQGAGDGGRQVLYDTEKGTKKGEVPVVGEEEPSVAEKFKNPEEAGQTEVEAKIPA